MFDNELQKEIRDSNEQFIREATERAKKLKDEPKEILLSKTELVTANADIIDLSEDLLNNFIEKSDLNVLYKSAEFLKIFDQLGLIEEKNGTYKPTGIGLLLFGKKPQLSYPNSVIRATYTTKSMKGEDIQTIQGPLITQGDKIQSRYEERIGKQIDRSKEKKKTYYDYPLIVFREAIINAIVHRDYDIEGAPIYFEINDDAIIIKSPGEPIKPLTLEQIKQFNAPSLSRNPKLMYVFDQMELVEQRGLGFKTIKELPTKHGIPLPIVTYDAPYMIFTFPRSYDAVKRVTDNPKVAQLSEAQLKGYEWLKTVNQASAREYSAYFNIGYKTAQRHLATLRELGLIRDNGQDANSPNYKYVANL
jgi:ATP-dependent DNA helicase RecG